MRILFDQGTPVPLRRYLDEHEVSTAYELGWSTLKNGDLLAEAEARGFALLVTTDRSLRYQQNLTGRAIAIVVLSTTSWPRIEAASAMLTRAVAGARAGSYVEVPIP